MKIGRTYLFYACMGSLVFSILSGRIGVFPLISGLVFGVLSIGFLHSSIKTTVLSHKFPVILSYAFHLTMLAIQATAGLAVLVFRKESPASAVSAYTGAIKNQEDRILIANSVTLTPGTIALEEDGCCLTVLSMGIGGSCGPETCLRLEKILCKEGAADA